MTDTKLSKQTIETLLAQIQKRFYQHNPKQFYSHRKQLIRAISYPAQWMAKKHLYCDCTKYQQLLTQKLIDIQRHGNPATYHAYFPTYLLKVLQDHFHKNYDKLYYELSHIRNLLETIAIRQQTSNIPEEHHIQQLANAHKLLQPSKKRTKKDHSQQMTLF